MNKCVFVDKYRFCKKVTRYGSIFLDYTIYLFILAVQFGQMVHEQQTI